MLLFLSSLCTKCLSNWFIFKVTTSMTKKFLVRHHYILTELGTDYLLDSFNDRFSFTFQDGCSHVIYFVFFLFQSLFIFHLRYILFWILFIYSSCLFQVQIGLSWFLSKSSCLLAESFCTEVHTLFYTCLFTMMIVEGLFILQTYSENGL